MMKNVLLVDDNPGILDAVRDCLQSRLPGVSMHASGTGIGALDIVRSWPIDMLITEVDLPDMNGYELIDQVRRQRPGMPVMVTTDDCSRKVVELLTSLGVNRWIEKPFDGKTIAATV
ncbi:MAG: response regulator, partial [Nitrospirae bacterium]|nr:response regulator [Nitrospirota bacterium]